MAGSIVTEETTSKSDDLVLSDLLLRCILHIVSDNEELAVIAFNAIHEYVARPDICAVVKEKYI